MTSSRTSSSIGARLGAVAIVGLVVLPLLPLLVWAVAGQWRYPALLPQRWSTRGLELLLDPHSQVLIGLITSAAIGLTVAVLSCAIGLPAGRAIGLYRFRGRRLVQALLLAPVIVPGLAVVLGIQVFFVRYGLSDSVFGVILVHLIPTVPYAAVILSGAFATYDVDYERQARALGATPVQVFWSVTLPLLRPALAVAALLTFLISWSEYVLTLLVGGGQVRTLPLLLLATIGSTDTTAAAAMALAMIVPPVLLVAVASRVLSGRSGGTIGLVRL